MWKIGLAIAFMAFAFAGGANAADPLRIYAAGSLSTVMPALVAASGLPEGAVAPPVFGPAGLLRKRLLAGEQADLFASADLAQPRAVADGKPAPVVPFARNRMCLLAPDRLGITADTLLDRMLSPALRLATSTPGADPGGDYAQAVFKRAGTLRPGAEATLAGKSLMLLGGPNSMSPQPGHSPAATIFLDNHADALLYLLQRHGGDGPRSAGAGLNAGAQCAGGRACLRAGRAFRPAGGQPARGVHALGAWAGDHRPRRVAAHRRTLTGKWRPGSPAGDPCVAGCFPCKARAWRSAGTVMARRLPALAGLPRKLIDRIRISLSMCRVMAVSSPGASSQTVGNAG